MSDSGSKKKIRILEIGGKEEIKLLLSMSDVKKRIEEQKSILKREHEKLVAKEREMINGKQIKKQIKEIEKSLKEPSKRAAKYLLPRVFVKTIHLSEKLDRSRIVDQYIIDLSGIKASGIGSRVYITSDHKYLIDDPILSEEEFANLQRIIEILFFMIDSDKIVSTDNIGEVLENILSKASVSPKVSYILKRDIIGYGVLDPLIKDPSIEDIQIPAPNVPAKIVHSEYGILESNIVFNETELDMYVEKMVHRANKAISLFVPFASVQLPEGHRLTVSYRREITTKGSSIIIRKFPEKPWSITKLLKYNSISPEMVAWLMILIEYKKGIIVAGVMGCGKTSTINGLCNLIPAKASVVTIEDTPELRLAHRYWIQHVTRDALTIDGKGSIGMFELVKHAMRESADYLIIGEVRGEEGRVWAQAVATGHGGITSFHAETPEAVILRLTTPPINVERGLLASLFSIVLNKRYIVIAHEENVIKRKVLRRAAAVYDLQINKESSQMEFVPIPVFKYVPNEDSFIQVINDISSTRAAETIIEEQGWDRKYFKEEYERRVKFFYRLRDHVSKYDKTPLLDYYQVSALIWLFQEDQNKAYEYIDQIEDRLSKEYVKTAKSVVEERRRKGIKILEIKGVE